MATDLKIYIDEGLTQADYRCFFGSHVGSVYEKQFQWQCPDAIKNGRYLCAHQERVLTSPHIFITESPWPVVQQWPKSEEERLTMPTPSEH